jgi:hypothetical protein
MALEIVFVHLGSNPPLHLLMNLSRTQKLFQDYKVTLLGNYESRRLTDRFNFVKIDFDQAEFSVESKYSYPKDFRNNFWFSSLARFSMIDKYMRSNNNSVLHVESDVILAQDFPMKSFEQIKESFAFPIVSQSRGIASTLFIKDSDSASTLWQFSSELVDENSLYSDMEILYELNSRNPELVLKLPIAPISLKSASINSQRTSNFGGYFDGHDFGVFLAGTNPWNERGVSRLHTKISESLLDFNSSNFIFDRSRDFISLKVDNHSALKLFSLHITNKNPIFFYHRTTGRALETWLKKLSSKTFTFHPFVWFIMLKRFILKKIRRATPS